MNIIKRCTPAFFALFFILSTGLSSSAHAHYQEDAFCGIKIVNKNDTDKVLEKYVLKTDGDWVPDVGYVQWSVIWEQYKDNDNWYSIKNESSGDILWVGKQHPHRVIRKVNGSKNQWWSQRAQFDDYTCQYDQ